MTQTTTGSQFIVPRVDLKALSGAALKLYWLLLDLCETHSAVTIEIPAHGVRDLAGLRSETTIIAAGRQLERAGLVKRSRGWDWVKYTLLDLATRRPVPGAGVYVYKRPQSGPTPASGEQVSGQGSVG